MVSKIGMIIVQKDASTTTEADALARYAYLETDFPDAVMKVKRGSRGWLEQVKGALGGRLDCEYFIFIPEDSIHLATEVIKRLVTLTQDGRGPWIYETSLAFPLYSYYFLRDRVLACNSKTLDNLGWEAILSAVLDKGCPPGFSIPRFDNQILFPIRERYFDTNPLPETMVIEPTSDCNFNCRMCPYHGAEGKNTPSFIPDGMGTLMELPFFQQIVDQLHDCQPKEMMLVTQSRGEPLLNPALVDMVRSVHKYPEFRISFSTNGFHLQGDLAKQLIEEQLEEVYISIHANTVETARKIGTAANFEVVEENIRNLVILKKEMGSSLPHIGLKFVHQKDNDAELLDFINKWVPLGVTVAVANKDRYALEQDSQQWVYDDLYRFPGVSDEMYKTPCFVPVTLPIYADGEAHLCYGTYKRDFVIGDAKTTSVKDIIFGEKRRQLLKESNMGERSRKPCDKCELRIGYVNVTGTMFGYKFSGNPAMISFDLE
jgi:MoaA/NifB/PqqE/SkfB family radical SAM enzyme